MKNPSAISRRQILGMAGASAAMWALPAIAASPLKALAPRGSKSVDHNNFSAMLSKFVKRDAHKYNRVDYRAFKASGEGAINAYVAMLETVDPTALSQNEAHAFWINLYNAKTLAVVLERYPVSSIRDIKLGGGGIFGSGGPWSKKLLSVKGMELSLDDIENRIVRPLFANPLSHYGLNCASYSCPNLAKAAYSGKSIGSLLSQGAGDYINHKRGIDISSKKITASKIYDWYADDFGGEGKLKVHWTQFATPKLAAQIETARIGSYAYDWSLNDV